MDNNLYEIKDTDEFNYAIKKINQWYEGNAGSLNIVTVPYNSTLIFHNIILNLVKENKQVLYIWNGRGIKKKLIDSIQSRDKNVRYGYITSGVSEDNIVFVNYKDISNIEGKYDLVIYDDISYYSSINNMEIKAIYKKALKKANKIILYSIEEVDVEDAFYLTPLSTAKPFVEPRIINTRINLDKDIPRILYDYLKWFRDEKKKVLLFVPREENAENVYEYYTNKLKMKDVKILKVFKSNCDDVKEEVLKTDNQSIFIITNDMEVILKDFTVDEAVILFSDDAFFSHKKLLYICAYIGKVNKVMAEVLLVSRDTSLDMDTAKDISRNFNKFIWEKKSK